MSDEIFAYADCIPQSASYTQDTQGDYTYNWACIQNNQLCMNGADCPEGQSCGNVTVSDEAQWGCVESSMCDTTGKINGLEGTITCFSGAKAVFTGLLTFAFGLLFA